MSILDYLLSGGAGTTLSNPVCGCGEQDCPRCHRCKNEDGKKVLCFECGVSECRVCIKLNIQDGSCYCYD